MKFSSIGEKVRARCGLRAGSRCAAWVLCFATVYCAKAMQAGGLPQASSVHVRANTAHAVSTSKHQAGQQDRKTPESISASAVAAPATVLLNNGSLTVEANNSDLGQILRNVADASGMTIKGDITTSRVFGVYGPGHPGDVLTALLAGSGNNFMMVGDTSNGAPRELLLLPQNAGPAASSAGPTAAVSGEGESPDADTSDEEPPGPGAITHVPPAGSQDPQVRMEQNLQRLEQMHEQQTQQDAPH